jgi:predicted NUDIX family phosphoesterase
MTDEHVLVIPAAHLRAVGHFQGFRPADPEYHRALLDSAHFSFRPRSTAEIDPAFKQLIPYVVLTHAGRVYAYRRAGGGEKRLNAKWSLGIGGHISDTDATTHGDLYTTGMMRELTEEVTIHGAYRAELIGFINDDETPVGRVHLGVVHRFELDSDDVRPNETGLADAGFVPWSEVLTRRDEFETWSQIVADVLTTGIGR